MSKSTDGLTELLGLKPLVAETMTFSDFLGSLKENPERADTAAALFVRAVKSLGEENIDEAHPDRQPYLRMLRSMKIPSYKAFSGVRGSQRVVARLMKFYEAAAQNGYQLRQMLVLCGGPGSGKSFLVDHLIRALEGQLVYAVAGCPEHESPMNLLKLLTPEVRLALSEKLDMLERDGDGKIVRDRLDDLLKVSQEPCAHCFRTVMGIDREHKHAEGHDCKTGCHDGDAHANQTATPNLSSFKVEALRLSSRNAGISVWTPSAPDQGCSLPVALRQGNRGVVRMQEAFDAKGAEAGAVSQLQVLLEATEGRRMPASAVSCGSSAGFIPLDQMQIIETNEGAWLRFVKDQEDPGKWHRRGQVFVMDYNTVVCEEAAAYAAFIKQLKAVPDLDPLVLTMLANAAVASRMKEEIEGAPSLAQRMRMYNGEPLLIEKKSSSINARPQNPWYGGGVAGTRYGTEKAQSTEAEEKNYSVSDLWLAAGEDEGRTGIDFGFMLSSVSQLCELGLQTKHKAVTALAAISYLRARVERESLRPGLADGIKKVLERSKKHLTLAMSKFGTVELIETEYRRLLKAQVLQAFSPDYETRAEDMFRKYHKHAVEWGKGKDKVFDERHNRMLAIDIAHLQKIEGAMGKYGDEAANFRRSLESEFIELMQAAAAAQKGEGEQLDRAVIFTWETHPELKKAIKKILDDEIALKVEKILGDDTNLGEEDRKLRTESIERFDRFGYSEPCRKVALAYFKEFELWK